MLKLLALITTEKKNDRHEYESIINIDFSTQTMSDFNDTFNCFDSHDFDIYKDVKDCEMNVNLSEDNQVMKIDLMEESIREYETHAKGSTNEPFLVGNGHIEQYQI